MRLGLAVSIAFVLCLPAKATTYKVVYYMQAYNQPGGLIEGSPGIFYSRAASPSWVIFSITAQGSISYLATFDPNTTIIDGPIISATNNLFYSSLQYTGGNTANNVISVSSSPGSLHTYPTQTDAINLSQNLPDGTLLGWNPYQLVKSNLNGSITLIYQLPALTRPEPPIYGTDGNYYGLIGLDADASGYVYKLTASGTLTTLYNFPAGSANTSFPAALLEASDGNLYGTTPTGGANQSGTVFKLTRGGQYTLLYTFPKSAAGIAGPLIEGSDGKLYGATFPSSGNSLLYSITKSGHYQVVYRMSNQAADGQCPCSLVQGSDGNIYGTAAAGGTKGAGVIFALNAGLPKPKPWPVQFRPKSGAVGARVRIWGYNLLSASVQFNGAAATTVSNSGSNYVLATVPAGATSGPITVATPGGSATTRATFMVK